jgi:hypothetical protein
MDFHAQETWRSDAAIDLREPDDQNKHWHAKEDRRVTTRLVTCPDCGLALTKEEGDERVALDYDVAAWRNVCKRVALGSPLWCLVQRDGTSPPQGGASAAIADEAAP